MPSLSIASLILVNLVPLAGVLFFGWNLSAIMVLYWSENVVIGLFNVVKMALAQGDPKESPMRLNYKPVKVAHKAFMIFFFMAHFGMFTLGHGVFVFAIFGKQLPPPATVVPAFLALFASHGLSFLVNFIRKEEYKRVAFTTLFVQPYKRIVIMHLTIILGAWASIALDRPVMALVVLITLKILLDAFSHKKEHTQFASRPPDSSPLSSFVSRKN
jgi:hypothetical protein